MTDAFFVPSGDGRFEPTDWTSGPWDPGSQHGGPPSALLGRTIEGADGANGKQVARITFELLGPVPIAPLSVHAEVVRPGRNVDLVEATLTADRVVMRARAWRLRTRALDHDGAVPHDAPPPGPESGREVEGFDVGTTVNYLAAMEWRFVEGTFLDPGPATAWLRMRIPLVPDEEPSPLQRVLAAADSGSGISAALDYRRWLFLNPDLSVYLHRPAAGEWVCLAAETTPGRNGIGLAITRLYDRDGRIGTGAQSLFIAPRDGVGGTR